MQKSLCMLVVAVAIVAPVNAEYFLAGSFNGWDPAATPMTEIVSGVYTAKLTNLPPGRHEFKVTQGSWSWSRPAANSWLHTDPSGSVTVTFNTNVANDGWQPAQNRIAVSTDPAAWTVAGSFNNWSNSDPAAAMTPLGGGIYMLTLTLHPGNHELKPVVTGAWDTIGLDGRSTSTSPMRVETAPGFETVTVLLNAFAGTVHVEGGKPQCGDPAHPYPPGDLNRDCRVDLTDLAILANNWLTSTAPASQ